MQPYDSHRTHVSSKHISVLFPRDIYGMPITALPPSAMLLRRERRNLGLTQEQLAERIGVSTSTVSRWEAGHHMPAPMYIIRLCHLFHKSAEDLGLAETLTLREQAPERLIDSSVPTSLACVGREHEQATIKACLMQPQPSLLTGLTGLAGVGKTTIIASIVQDQDLLTHYPDGVLWATLGPSPELHMHLARWGALLHLPMETDGNPQAWREQLRQTLRTRRMLLVLDNAWNLQDILALLIAGPRCAYVITTCFPSLIASLRAVSFPIPPWEPHQSDLWLRHVAPMSTHLDPPPSNGCWLPPEGSRSQ
ncbi:helix-turn-helix domain-containing protein [Ktedonospora formicarum]|uniref:HTH cro/C1-type domain-containing protein n=1 Tax=Ktedonospora formicarum TaxID=2778364 RepID=A0A8J3I4Q3_9CHLR|nr:helix-turn-helix domain-containing protein [Ktedonospora formicarum]GHO48666.1 hypothetical protein KSX_68290 [Ktedonospora formicarum]